MPEYQIGEKCKVNGRAYVVVRSNGTEWSCDGCVLYSECSGQWRYRSVVGECVGWRRSDGCNVHFERFGNDAHSRARKGGE